LYLPFVISSRQKMNSVFPGITGISFLLLVFSCRPAPKHYLDHRWSGDDGNQIMIFDGDSSLQWIFHEPTLSDTFLVRYRLDQSATPNRLDLYNFSSGILKGKILAGIVQPLSPDSIQLDFEPAETWAEADSVRPRTFDPEQRRVFVKVK